MLVRITFDVGGTTIRMGSFRGAQLVMKKHRETPNCWNMPLATADQIRQALFEELRQLVESIVDEGHPETVGVAFPGPITPQGLVLAAPTIWGDRDTAPYPLRAKLQTIWPKSRLIVMNDVTAAGYYHAQRYQDFLIVTVSSGIGSKLFLGGRPILGPNGDAGEIGHITVDYTMSAPLCECGGRGHLAALACGRAPFRHAMKDHSEMINVDGRGSDAIREFNEQLLDGLRRADETALSVVANMARPLGHVLALIQATVGIKTFIIMGGFAVAAGEIYRQLVVAAAQAASQCSDWNEMVKLDDDNESSLKGALIPCLEAKTTEADEIF